MGMWDGIRAAFTRPKRRGFLGIEDAAVRHRWVVPLLCVGAVALVIRAFAEAVASR